MTPRDLILGFLGRGPAVRAAIVGYLLGRGLDHDEAEREVGRVLLDLQRVGRVESFGGMDCWRLTTSAAAMEEA